MPSLPFQLFNKAFGQYLKWRVPRLERTRVRPIEFQERWFDHLVLQGSQTDFGKNHGFKDIKSYEDFRNQVPIRNYDGHLPYINRMLDGEHSVLWPGFVKWFSKSSGTTSDRSKYLPVSNENLQKNHIRGGWDAMSFYYSQRPNASLFARKNLIMGGAIQETRPSGIQIGDVSAVMLANFPQIAKPVYTPSFEIMLMKNYEHKLEKTAQYALNDDVGLLGGVPNWTMMLMQRILEITGASNIKEVWPNFQLFTHGGISFAPYKKQFQQIIGPDPIDFIEVYNASEGYFGSTDVLGRDDMMLHIDNGTFFEFMPQGEWGREFPHAIPLSEVVVGETYGVVISTNSGLWRYDLGDTIQFTSIAPYRFKITGRTKQCINTFGEEVMVSNADLALERACVKNKCQVIEYTATSRFVGTSGAQGAHHWLIEFLTEPQNIERFCFDLDQELKNINSDYAAKRNNNLGLFPIMLDQLPKGAFHNWMKSKGKLGGQGKVPRLSEDSKYVDALLAEYTPIKQARLDTTYV